MKKLIIFLAVYLFASPINIINDYRKAVGLNTFIENPSLTLAAKWHCKYIYANKTVTHYEKKYGKNFTGKTPADRAVNSGYYSRFVIENLSKGESSYEKSVKDLFSAIYHRLGFLNFNVNEIGFYKLKDIYVYDMGNREINKACKYNNDATSGFMNVCKDKKKIIPESVYYSQMQKNPKVVFWPYNHMKNVPAVFYDEIPDPLPEYGVCGYPVSISFNPKLVKKVNLISFELYKGDQKIERTKLLTSENDVNHMLKKTEFVLFPLERLEYGESYHVKADFVVDGRIKSFTWEFEVEDKSVPIINVMGTNGTYYIKPDVTYLIYFKPLNGSDKLSRLRYEFLRGLKINQIGFKDANTLYLNISGNNGSKLTIKTKKRNITLVIKDEK